MNIKIIGSTKEGYELSKKDAIIFSGKAAGICYLPQDIDTLFSEKEEKTLRRANGNLQSGHHSVFGHTTYNLIFENIPKILAMILNNEKIYNTSEKSARYTKMDITGKEKELYEKWLEIFFEKIKEIYPKFDDKKIKKLAQENARYLISIFTPSTIMEYTVSLGQLNYIINWAKEYIEKEEENTFSIQLKEVLKEFIDKLSHLEIEGLNSKMKNRQFSIFAKRDRCEEFGENFCTTYLGSFAQLAQAQRHRTLSYEMRILKETQYYIPPIIRGDKLEEQWKKDMELLSQKYPQGMLVQINERGTIENFILKCSERLCGEAQLEVMEQTNLTLHNYLENVKDSEMLYNYLLPYTKGARCTFPNWKCNNPCYFGAKYGIDRKI